MNIDAEKLRELIVTKCGSLAEGARLLGTSPSTINHILKRGTCANHMYYNFQNTLGFEKSDSSLETSNGKKLDTVSEEDKNYILNAKRDEEYKPIPFAERMAMIERGEAKVEDWTGRPVENEDEHEDRLDTLSYFRRRTGSVDKWKSLKRWIADKFINGEEVTAIEVMNYMSIMEGEN